jgi:peptide/nickel transport system ATP-binding protein
MIGLMSTTNMTADVLLRVRDLSVEFPSKRLLKAVDGVSLDVRAGEILGLVGETGSGKTVFVTSILGLIRKPGRITHGSITWRGRDLLDLKERELRSIRGTEISMVFQNPLPSLNPSKRIGAQVRDLLIYHGICPKQQAEDHAVALLHRVQLPDPERVMTLYPFECSGGMCQRILIAMALCGKPKLLIADEPTTSLDVTVQAQIIRLILQLKHEFGMAVLFVSHDLGVMASICDRVAVMYRGRIVETARSVDLFSNPSHPYTQALLRSSLLFSGRGSADPLGDQVLEETSLDVPDGLGCRFFSRCPESISSCQTVDPSLTLLTGSDGHSVACIRRCPANTRVNI